MHSTVINKEKKRNNTLTEKESYKYLEILEVDTTKRKKIKKSIKGICQKNTKTTKIQIVGEITCTHYMLQEKEQEEDSPTLRIMRIEQMTKF